MSLGTFILVTLADDQVAVKPRQRKKILEAYTAWVEDEVDSVLELTQTNGDAYVMRASQIETYIVSTERGRLHQILLGGEANDEGLILQADTIEEDE